MPAPQLLVIASGVLMAVSQHGATSNAELLCLVMDNTRSIAPCAISEVRHAVTINIKLKGENADEMCRQVQTSLVKQRMFFDGGTWRLNITTPSNGSRVIASCDLPQTPK
jgi:hypothetical protein